MKRIEGKEAERLIELGIGREEKEAVILNDIEYAYAVSNKILMDNNNDFVDRIKTSNEYKIYSFLMNRGYICRFSEGSGFIRVGRKGYRRGEDRTYFLIKIVKNDLCLDEIKVDMEISNKLRKKLVYAFFEKEKIRFMEISPKSFI